MSSNYGQLRKYRDKTFDAFKEAAQKLGYEAVPVEEICDCRYNTNRVGVKVEKGKVVSWKQG